MTKPYIQKTYYEKIKDNFEMLKGKDLHTFAEWYLGEESDAYNDNKDDEDNLSEQCMQDIFNDMKIDGEESENLEEIHEKIHAILFTDNK